MNSGCSGGRSWAYPQASHHLKWPVIHGLRRSDLEVSTQCLSMFVLDIGKCDYRARSAEAAVIGSACGAASRRRLSGSDRCTFEQSRTPDDSYLHLHEYHSVSQSNKPMNCRGPSIVKVLYGTPQRTPVKCRSRKRRYWFCIPCVYKSNEAQSNDLPSSHATSEMTADK